MSKGPWRRGHVNTGLLARLTTIFECVDPRCHLCGRCLAAARGEEAREAPPPVAVDDPIRTWRTWAGPRRVA